MNDECLVHLIDGPSRSGRTLFAHFLAEFYRTLQVACDSIDTNLANPLFGIRYAPKYYKRMGKEIEVEKGHQIQFDDRLVNTDLLYSLLGRNDAIIDVNSTNNLTHWLKRHAHLYPKHIRFVRWCLLPDAERLRDLVELGNLKGGSSNHSVVLVPNYHFADFGTLLNTSLPDNHYTLDFPRLVLSNRDRTLWNKQDLTVRQMGGNTSPLYQLSRTRFVIYQRKFYAIALFSQLMFNSVSLKRDGILRVDSMVF